MDPTSNTKKTPPTFFSPNSDIELGLLTHCPPPFCFHQRSFNVNSTPVSCNLSIAEDKRFLCFESNEATIIIN